MKVGQRQVAQKVKYQQNVIDHLKRSVFFTIKHDILKQIKDNELDKLIAVLRRRKFAKLYTIFSLINQITLKTSKEVREGREKLIRRNYFHLMQFKIYTRVRRAC